MTDQKEYYAGLVERLEAWAPLVASGYECPAASTAMYESAQEIRTLLVQVEELRRERDTWKEIAEKTAASGSSISRKLDTAKAQLAEAEAGMAEAVKALEPFSERAGKLDGHWLDHETHWSPAYGATEITIGDLRAARAFVEKHK